MTEATIATEDTGTALPDWRNGYGWDTARKDFQAGLTVAAISLPQSIAYALIAGVDPRFGLYTAIVFTAIAALLVKANPEREATVTDAPDEILLIFNDSVGQEFLALAVIDPSGKRVDNHDAKLDFTDHSHLRASVSKLAPGRYTVRYRVLSADGHVVSGKYFFDVQGK